MIVSHGAGGADFSILRVGSSVATALGWKTPGAVEGRARQVVS
jgi:hypothetical protein